MKEKILKGKVTKRLLSVVLALAMILTPMPQDSMMVYAEEKSSSESSIELQYAFIPMFLNDKVKVVNTENHQEVKTISVGARPNSAAVTSDGKYCLVTNRFGNSVSVIDVANLSVISTITGIPQAEGIGFSDDNTCAYVASSDGIYKIEIGGTWNNQLTNFKINVNILVVARNKIYAMNENSENLYVVDPENNFTYDTKTIKNSFGLSTAVDGKSVYLGDKGTNNIIHKVDIASGAITDIELSQSVTQPVFDFSEDGKYLYIVDSNAKIIKYDLEDEKEVQTADLQVYEGCFSCGITFDQKYLYILSYSSNKLVVVDTSSLKKVQECAVDGPFVVGTFMATGRTVRLYKEKYLHTHAWNYQVDRNEISVYCSSSEGSNYCAANGVDDRKTLTLSDAADLTYNGQQKTATVTGQEEFVALTKATVGDINYEGVGETSYTKQTTAPTNAGTYKATVSVTAANSTVYTAEKEFTIAKADATCNVTANNLTYNGNEQELVTSTKNGCTIYYRVGENGEWSTTVPKAKDAGNYDIYYYGEADSNHNSDGSEGSPKGPVSVTIAKKALNAEMITINPASKVFDDAPTTPEVTVSDMVDSTQCITEDDYEISGADAQVEVGDYTITVTAKDNGNYSGSAQKTWSITGANFGESDITVKSYEADYDGESHGINITLSGAAEGAVITYSETESGTYTTTNPTYKNVKTTDGGTYTVYYKVNKRGYYEKKGSSTVKINPKEGGLGDHNPKVAYYGPKDSGVKTVSLWPGFNALDGVSYEVSSFDNNGIISEASVSPKGVVSYTLTGTSENDARAYIYIVVHSTNYEDKTVEVTVDVDATPPTGSIAIHDTTILWTNFLESSSFGTFLKKNNQAVTITGSDVGGKPVDIWYFVSDNRMTLDAVKEMADTEWTALSQNGTISLLDGKNVIYAKLKDHVGNTTYLSSNGIVIYEDAAGVTTELSYVSKSGKTATAKVDLKGNTIKAVAIVSGDTTTALTKDTDYTVSENGTITFTNTYLETLAVSATPYKFKVSYQPAGVEYVTAEGNEAPAETELSLTVSKDTGTTSGGGNGTPSIPSGGNGTPSTPGGGDSKPSTPTEDYTIPVKSENTVEVKAEIKEGTADVSEITAETINKVTDAKGESKVDTIKIDLSGAKQDVTGVTISKKSVETLAKATKDNTNGIDTVTIELSKATVVLDTKTLETLAEDAKGTNIRLVVDDKEHKDLNTSQQTAVKEYHVATSFEAYFESDGTRIHDFRGGKATVSIDFTPEAGKSIEHYHMVYLPDEGGMTRFKTKYENGQLVFTTTHFSDYAVIYDENEKNETGNEEEKPAEGKPAEEEKPVDNKPAKAQIAANTIAINKGLKVSQTGTKINVSWGKVADADGYLVYAAYCGTDFGKAVKTVKDPSSVSTAITKINGKKLDLKRNFKVYVKAYKVVDGKKIAFGKSISAHIVGVKNTKNTNVKEIKLTSKSKLALTRGKTSKIQAKVVLVNPAKKQLSDAHAAQFRYASSDKTVATVDKNGKITAKAKGTCTIYVYARNGYAKKVKVTVK